MLGGQKFVTPALGFPNRERKSNLYILVKHLSL